MDAAELMEWVAYFQTTDEKKCAELQEKISKEMSHIESNKLLRTFLENIRRKNGS